MADTQLPIVNADFEAPLDLERWTTTKGSPTAGAAEHAGFGNPAYSGSNYLKHLNSDAQDYEVEQRFSVTGAATELTVLGHSLQTSNLSDIPYTEVEFFDGNGLSLGVERQYWPTPSIDNWTSQSSTFAVPGGTQEIALRFGGEYNAGSITNAAIDQVSAFLNADVLIEGPPEVTPLAPKYVGGPVVVFRPPPLPPEYLSGGIGRLFDGSFRSERDQVYGGLGKIYGVVKDKDGNPIHRRVVLMLRENFVVVAGGWSDPMTGQYQFDYLDEDADYLILGFDYTGEYNAVIEDRVTTEPMDDFAFGRP